MIALTFERHGTTIYTDESTLRASRVIVGKLLTISTKAKITVEEFAKRVNSLAKLSNEDFELLCDQNVPEMDF